jgi:hypothetical protein
MSPYIGVDGRWGERCRAVLLLERDAGRAVALRAMVNSFSTVK